MPESIFCDQYLSQYMPLIGKWNFHSCYQNINSEILLGIVRVGIQRGQGVLFQLYHRFILGETMKKFNYLVSCLYLS